MKSKFYSLLMMLGIATASTAQTDWHITGNSGTSPSTNFLGTTDAQNLQFRVNNQKAGYIDYGSGNVSFGYQTLLSNSTGTSNTAFGHQALYSSTTAQSSTATGYQALYTDSTGSNNTATGYQSLRFTTVGSNNTAAGYRSLDLNVGGKDNIAIGVYSLRSNINTSDNVAVGDSALYHSISTYNTAVGNESLFGNTTGSSNSAVGYSSLANSTTGYNNTAVGFYGLNNTTTGFALSTYGAYADIADSVSYNATAIGYGAIATANNQVMLGNTSVTSVKAAGTYIIYSDGRYKKDIKDNVPGLAFINQLKPVTYHYDIHGMNAKMGIITSPNAGTDNASGNKVAEDAITQKEKKLYTGFVAQDVESAAKKLNYDFSGVYKPQNSKDLYGLSYSDFVVPLVKSVQELSKLNDHKDSMISDLQDQINALKAVVNTIQNNTAYQSAAGGASASASLLQNAPNPFSGVTTIAYTLPAKYSSAQILIYTKDGKAIKRISLSGSGSGTTSVSASLMASGAYNYSLLVNGNVIASKQMLVTK